MPKPVYIISFVVMAFLFVPVFLFFMVAWSITPCSYQVYFILSHVDWDAPSLFLQAFRAGYVAFYTAVFYTVAINSFRALAMIRRRELQVLLQVAILLALFSCSFLKVIYKESVYGPSGTYNFWTACARFTKGT